MAEHASPQPDLGPAWLSFGLAVVERAGGDATDGPPDLGELRQRFEDSLQEPSPFAIVASNAGVDRDDAEVLAILVAAEFKPSAHHRIATLQRDPAKNRITLGTLLRLCSGLPEHRGVLSVAADAPLCVSGLVRVLPDGPWSDHIVALHPAVVWALVGDRSTDPDLPTVRARLSTDDERGGAITVVTGPDRERRRRSAIVATAGRRFLVVAAPTDEPGWMAVVREATITGSSVVVEVDGERLDASGRRTIERAVHVPWAISSRLDLAIEDLPDRSWLAVHATSDPPTDDEWEAAFGQHVERTHPLTSEQLADVARAFHALDRDLDAAVRRIVSGRLDAMARRVRPTRTWSDLVLSEDRKETLRSIVDRYAHARRVFHEWGFARSTSIGTVALFSGPSGTGKTMAAEIIAGELGLDVFKLDLSAVVSKYIGETEKNLAQVFDAASAGNLVLFFDEADALFGKRSEVRDARDRYANIEVSYLLQRLEAYDGLVIMATNFEKNVDDAFLRRIHVRVEFGLPGPDERQSIWEHNLPSEAPVEGVDLRWLAQQFELSGGMIRNSAVHAAFIAASRHVPISTEILVLGVAREHRKIGRLIKREQFGNYYELANSALGNGQERG